MTEFQKEMYTIFSFCSGMDNMGLGFRNAGFTQVGWSEINKASSLLNSQIKNIGKNYEDMRQISKDPTILPDFDVACAGLPCPAFSIAGKRTKNPFDQKDVGGDLFEHFCKIISVKKPRFLFLEQVKGVLSAGRWKGEIFSQILTSLSDMGYDAEWQVLNSKNFGLPQNRERLFLVGYSRNKPRPEIFPITGETNSYTCKSESAKTAVARTLSAGAHTGGNHSGMTILQINNPTHSNDRVYSDQGISPTINSCSGGNRQPFVLTEVRTEEAKQIRREIKKATGKDHSPRRKKDIVPRKDGLVGALTASRSVEHELYDGKQLRRLTPREFFRLQGTPDSVFDLAKSLNISDTQLFLMAGNSVSVPVIEEIAKKLIKTPSHYY